MMDEDDYNLCRTYACRVKGRVSRDARSVPQLSAEQIYFLRVHITETIGELRAALDILDVALTAPKTG